jgi:hypothetical protein
MAAVSRVHRVIESARGHVFHRCCALFAVCVCVLFFCQGRAFVGFDEGPLQFRPTYRVLVKGVCSGDDDCDS